jgi:hypothetical protein
MRHKKLKLSSVFLFGIGITGLHAQSTIPVSGGNATGSGGSVSYSVGQIVYTTNSGTNGAIAQGVQQPYEISVVTEIKNTEEINLVYIVYPNPTRGQVKLIVKTKYFDNLKFQLYDLNGICIQDKKIDGEEIEIIMDRLIPSTYFLKVLSGNKELKTFKIIKN